jgi:hypothetical protein
VRLSCISSKFGALLTVYSLYFPPVEEPKVDISIKEADDEVTAFKENEGKIEEIEAVTPKGSPKKETETEATAPKGDEEINQAQTEAPKDGTEKSTEAEATAPKGGTDTVDTVAVGQPTTAEEENDVAEGSDAPVKV